MPTDLDQTTQVEALTNALPYLRESGWIRSNVSQASVDAEGEPIPWYRYAAIDFLAGRVDRGHRVFEFGSGNSTLWWAKHAHSVTAVEHHAEWAASVRAAAPDRPSNCFAI